MVQDFSSSLEIHELQRVYSFAYENLHSLGIIRRSNETVRPLPVTLFPSSFSRKLYDNAIKIQGSINDLMHQVSQDSELIIRIHKPIIDEDPFVKNIFEIYEKVGYNKSLKITLGMNRTDFMEDSKNGETKLKQIEVNLMASSYGGMIKKVNEFHHSIMGTLGLNVVLPSAESNKIFAQALCSALKEYSALYEQKSVTIAMIVGEYEVNEYDQRSLENEVYKTCSGVRIIRVSFEFLSLHTNEWYLTNDQRLIIQGKEVGVVYYRHGYSPDHYINQEFWNIRYKLETSIAVSCPSVSYMLANTKITQAALSNREIFDRYTFTEPEHKEILWATFGRQVALSSIFGLSSDEEIHAIINEAMSSADKFVLKPQREGGSNNFYGDEMVKLLKETPMKHLKSYVLMERFNPSMKKNYVVNTKIKPSTLLASKDSLKMPEPIQMVGELGIYGTYLVVNDHVKINNTAGYLLRSKMHGENEGGVTLGYSSLDTPALD